MSLIPELKVHELAKSLDFYTLLAGFKILYQRPGFAMLENNGAKLMIETIANHRCWGIMEGPFGRGIHLQIEVRDVDSLYQSFMKANYPIFFAMEEKWYQIGESEQGQRQFLVEDPDGFLLRFFSKVSRRVFPEDSG